MREMLAARTDRDFVAAEPPRPRQANARNSPARGGARPGKARASARATASAGALRAAGRLILRALILAARHPVEILIAGVIGGAGGVIAWNALAVQTARHPAPLFGEFKPEKRAVAVPRAPSRPVPELAIASPRPPAQRDGIGDLIRAGEAARPGKFSEPAAEGSKHPEPSPKPPAVRAPPLPPAAPARDSIGDLIRSGEVKPPAIAAAPASRDPIGELLKGENPVPPGFVGRQDASGAVAAGQRALAKLKYGALAVDGRMGPETREAIQRFERDRKLPVTGELGPRTARELAAASGIPSE